MDWLGLLLSTAVIDIQAYRRSYIEKILVRIAHRGAGMLATQDQVSALSAIKYGNLEDAGWGPRLRDRMGYFTPDDWYEATVWNLVGPTTDWLDVGCGRDLFPSN